MVSSIRISKHRELCVKCFVNIKHTNILKHENHGYKVNNNQDQVSHETILLSYSWLLGLVSFYKFFFLR